MTTFVGTDYKHVSLDERGIPYVAETTMKVSQLVLEHMIYRWGPEAIQHQHPYLSLGQIYSALAYYWDHTDQLDKQIEQEEQAVERLRQEMGEHPFVARMRAQGRLR